MKKNRAQQNIPDGWKEVKLSSIGTFLKGAAISKEQLTPTGHNAIRYGELYSKFDFKIKKIYSFIPDDVASLATKIKFGDILFAGSGETIDEIGKSAAYLLHEDAYAGGDTIIFRPKDDVNSLFLAYTLNNGDSRKKLRELGQGQSVVHIYKDDIAGLSVHLPSRPEQDRIVQIIEAWSDTADHIQTKIELKSKLKSGLMRDLLSGKVRLSGFTSDWKAQPLSNLVDYCPRPIPKPSENFTAIGVRSHCKGTFRKENVDPKSIDMDVLYELRENDLLVNITFAWEGAIAIVGKENSDGLVSHRFPTYVFKDGIGSPHFFRQYIQSKHLRHQLKIISPGGAGRNRVLSKKEFLKLKVKVPSYKEQVAIAKVLSTADKELTDLREKLSLLESQKKYLMDNLISGKIRIQVEIPEVETKTPLATA